MKRLTILCSLIFLASFFGYGQKQIFLKWKLNSSDTLIYTTVMEQIDSNYFEANFDTFFKQIADSTSKKETKEVKDIFKEVNKAIGNTQYAVRMFKSEKGHIEIEMFTINKEHPLTFEDSLDVDNDIKNSITQHFQEFLTGVVLRGSVNEDGTIHSFWLKRAQKNLIAVFFELPGKPIKLGDTWKISTNFIGNDQNFICDSSFFKNEVKLIDIRKIKGETVAVIKYDVQEYVDGTFNMPSMFGESGASSSMMNFEYKGIAEFSIERGKWVSFEGLMSLNSTGIMSSKQKVKYSLIEL